jgi:hypothetical protein
MKNIKEWWRGGRNGAADKQSISRSKNLREPKLKPNTPKDRPKTRSGKLGDEP